MSWKRILIAVDDSAATRRAIRYVMELASPSKIDHMVLLHVLDPLPPALLEHSGGLDRDALDRLIQAREAYRHNRAGAESAILSQIRAQLVREGFIDERVALQLSAAVDNNETTELVLAAARNYECGTIVVGRESFPRWENVLRHPIADELVREAKGCSVWVVE